VRIIENKTFDEERALYGSDGVTAIGCRFEGPADGESAFKESRNITVENCFWDLRYPFWHDTNLVIRSTELTEKCRAALWYSKSISISDSKLHGIKALRECDNVYIDGCDVISPEFGWFVRGIRMTNTSVSGEYFMMRSNELKFDNVTLNGKYSFQYIENSTFENCVFNREGDAYNIWTYSGKEVNFINCTFNCDGKAVLIYNEGNNGTIVNFDGCKFYSNGSFEGKAAIEIDSSLAKAGQEYIVNINDCEVNGFAEGSVSKNNLWNNKKGVKTLVVVEGVNHVFTNEKLESLIKANEKEIKIVLEKDLAINTGDAYLKLGGADTEVIQIEGKTKETVLTLETSYWSRINLVNAEGKFSFKNLTITSSQTSGTWNGYDVTFKANTDVENVIFSKAVALDAIGATFNFKNVEINETHDYYALWITPTNTVNIDGLVVNSNGRGIKVDAEYMSGDLTETNLTVKNAVFNTAKKAAIVLKATYKNVTTDSTVKVTLSNVDISNVAKDSVNAVWIDEDWTNHAGKVVVTGGSVVVENQ
jgi:hypothetical protein